MNLFNPLGIAGFAVLGAALLWAVQLAYGERRGPKDDLLKRLLLLAGWVLLIGGTVGVILGTTFVAGVFPLLGVVVVGFCYFKYVEAERRALLWALAAAADKGIPLEQAARAFADERAVQVGIRVIRLAETLEAGVPLPQALSLARLNPPADALLAVRLGAQTGRLNESLQVSRDYQDHFDTIARNVLAKYLYFFIIALVGLFVITFLMLKIMPVFVKMFEEFELELPAITQFVVAVSAVVNRTVFLFLPTVLFLVSIPLVTGLGYYFGWSRYELPLVQRFWLRCDTALVLRALALAVRQQRPLGPAIYQLAGLYPRASVGRRLERASGLINNGASWTQALLAAGVIRDAERAVLNSAERVGNLAWALDEMADSTLRRFVHRLRIVIDLLFPLMVLAFSATVAMLALGAILPLVAMIQGLS